jgi:hypothetical protein
MSSGSTGAGPARTARYVPGAGNVVVRGDVLVALPYAPAERSAAVWDALDGAAGVMDALQVLSSTFDAGLAALPPFAVVVLTSGGRAHVLVRGDVEVRVDGHDGPTELHGRDVSTWTERAVDGVDGVSVRLGTAGATSDDAPTTLPFVGGVVRAKAVSWGSTAWTQAAGRPSDAAATAAALRLSEPTEPPAEEPAAPPSVQAAPAEDAPRTSPAAAPELPALVTSVPGPGTASELTLAPMETLAPGFETVGSSADGVAPAGRAAEPAGVVGTPGDTPGQVGSPADDAAPAEPVPAESPADDALPAPDQPVADEYESLWETTIHRSVEEAAVRVDESDEEDEAAAAPALVSGVPRDFAAAPPPAPPAPAASATPASAASATPVSAASATPEPDAAAGPAADGPDGFDHDGHTVMGSSVADLRAVAAAAAAQLAASGDLPAFASRPDVAGPAAEQPVPGPPLVARACPSGHANPPSREHCASCGAPLSGQTQTVARPPLGRVRVSSGEGGDAQVFPLDRPLVVGRRPRSPKGAAGGGDSALHRIVTVPSPQQDISRSHVEVRLEGWNVLAVDLNTTNGTTLLRPGQSPLRMHPGDPQLVVSGDVVDLGDGVTLAFEEVP